jgi:acetylornithine deacetylase
LQQEEVIQKVLAEIARLEEEMIATAQQLVRIPSVVGNELEAQKFVEAKIREIGLKVEIFEAKLNEVKEHESFIPVSYPYENRPNVVGVLEGAPESPSLILNGHIDVVSPEPLSQWKFDPWGGVIHEGRLYGRGTVDMKGGIIANLFALKAILKSGFKPKGKLIWESVVEEEAGGGGGALACFIRGYKADGMLIPEPSEHAVLVQHAGIKYFRVRVVGKTAHAALSHTGVNAIGKMNKIYDALIALDEKRARDHRWPMVENSGGRSCNLNIGIYSAGDWASSVAGMAAMDCRIGFVPGEMGKDIMKEVEETISQVAQKDSWLKEHPPSIEWYGWDTEPWVQDEKDKFVQAFLESSTPILGKMPEFRGITGALDTRFGKYFGTPAFSFGPKGDRIHGPDEYVEIESLKTVTQVIAKFVLDWCGYEKL